MTAKPKIHAAANLFPMLPENELRELAADIQENGLQVPLVKTPGGELLDGRNRWLACEAAGVPARFEVYEGDPFRYVVSANLHRRHLSDQQRALIAAKLASLGIGANRLEEETAKLDHWLLSYIDSKGGAVQAQQIYVDGEKAGYSKDQLRLARKRLKLDWTGSGNDWVWSRSGGTAAEVPPLGDTVQPPTHAEAADMMNVSKSSVDRSRMVLHHGTPAIQKAVEDGLLPLSSAARTAKAYTPEQQNNVVQRLRNGEKWTHVVPSLEDAPETRDFRATGQAVTRVPRRPPGGVRAELDQDMTQRLVSALDGYDAGLASVTTVADDVTPELAKAACQVLEKFSRTLRRVRRMLSEIQSK